MPAVSDRWSVRCRCLPHIHSGSARLWRGRNGAGETGHVSGSQVGRDGSGGQTRGARADFALWAYLAWGRGRFGIGALLTLWEQSAALYTHGPEESEETFIHTSSPGGGSVCRPRSAEHARSSASLSFSLCV